MEEDEQPIVLQGKEQHSEELIVIGKGAYRAVFPDIIEYIVV